MNNKIFSIILLLSLNSLAKDIPLLNKTINDYSNIISNKESVEIDQMIRDYFLKTTNQLGVLIIDSLEGDNLEDYANRAFSKWQLGDAKKDNGVLLLFVTKDRKMRIEVGQGLEGRLTDVESKRILGELKTYLRSSQYGQAILKEIQLITSTIDRNEKLEPPVPQKSQEEILAEEKIKDEHFDFVLNILGLIIISWVGVNFLFLGWKNYKNKKRIEKVMVVIMKLQEKYSDMEKLSIDKKEKVSKVEEDLFELNNRYEKSDLCKEDLLKGAYKSVLEELSGRKSVLEYLKNEAKRLGVRL